MAALEHRLELLLLCDYEPGVANTIIDHVHGIRDLSRHIVHVLSFAGALPENLDLRRFDGLIIHYSLAACMDAFIDERARAAIREFRGLKAAFVQDEYRFIDMTNAALRDLGIHVLFTCIPPDLVDVVYPPSKLPGVRRETVLTGYVPVELTRVPAPRYGDRPIDIGYRARRVPAWLGSFGVEKFLIAERVLRDASRYALRCDISTREVDRLYGARWTEFLTSCKAVLGTESGAGVFDFSGEVQRQVDDHARRDPTVTFEELRDRYFREEDGRYVLHVISPRIFEAAALRTLMILYEGTYSHLLEPWRHYVPLRKDHANMDEVVAVLRDNARAEEIIARAYDEVALEPRNTFAAMVRQFDVAMSETHGAEMRATGTPYAAGQFVRLQRKARQHRVRTRRLNAFRRRIDGILALLPAPVGHRVQYALGVARRRLFPARQGR